MSVTSLKILLNTNLLRGLMIFDEVFLKNVIFFNTNSLFIEDHSVKLIIKRTMSNKAHFFFFLIHRST